MTKEQDEEYLPNDPESSALARKRRKKRMQRRAQEPASGEKRSREEFEEEEADEVVSGERKKPHPTGIKRQARYDPGVKMTKEELTAWRKEARRVRNRESAAESRNRTRGRIKELEDQVEALTTKYQGALKRIVELEAAAAVTDNDAVVNPTLPLNSQVISPCPSAEASPVLSPLVPVSPSVSPRSSFSLDDDHQREVENKYQHIMNMIRPTA
jgi:hypothetical protein